MTIFKNLNIEVKKQYRNNKSVRRHIGLTPGHAMAIDEITILHEMEQGYTTYPSAIINFAMEHLIKSIDSYWTTIAILNISEYKQFNKVKSIRW